MKDDRSRRVEPGQRFREQPCGLEASHPDQLVRGPGGIDERPDEIEDRPDRKVPADRGDFAHRRVKRWREEKDETVAFERLLGLLAGPFDRNSERFENVGGTAARGDGSVAMLGDGDTRRRANQRGRGGDVERAGAAPARSAGVQKRPRASAHFDHPLPESRDRPGELVRRFAPRRESKQERSLSCLARRARHQIGKRQSRLVKRQRAPLREPANRARKAHAQPRTKFSSSRGPSDVRIDSG